MGYKNSDIMKPIFWTIFRMKSWSTAIRSMPNFVMILPAGNGRLLAADAGSFVQDIQIKHKIIFSKIITSFLLYFQTFQTIASILYWSSSILQRLRFINSVNNFSNDIISRLNNSGIHFSIYTIQTNFFFDHWLQIPRETLILASLRGRGVLES